MEFNLWRAEMDALSFRNGVAVAQDDVSGKDLLPALVMQARAEEMPYFF